ncbi:N-acetylmuramic acid 6-phosphate etherase [Microbacterium bovistercoris]|uniref:N-acetylmuramic acid 6-phosphate etherase n=1 Tax=Microbacterium bovistercoris TaxID=2293570 RepID=A0A371NQC2_9MICO|nr:N-acetylmuramic acid 6-phosphate etherase [Microbacterium bovistercoris]REJ04350.1 N-acetylmuramic acid 6-phosphate etherase [Microbacterium bovistercoris]
MTRDDALRQELGTLSTEAVDPAYAELDLLGTDEQVALMLQQGVQAAEAVARQGQAIARAVDGIVGRRAAGGRLIYIGAGTAGRMGVLDASEIPPTYGTAPDEVVGLIAGGDVAVRAAVENAEDDDVAGRAAVDGIGLTADDAIVGISASGRTPYVAGALARAQELGAFTISLAGNGGSAISRGVDVAIEVDAGPEIVAGSTRLKAGTVQKLVLNALSTLAMVQEGKVLGNLMVDVQATNEKLRVRAQRIVMNATGCDATTAASALDSAGGSAKVAIAIAASGTDSQTARAALEASGGRLRPALEQLRAE